MKLGFAPNLVSVVLVAILGHSPQARAFTVSEVMASDLKEEIRRNLRVTLREIKVYHYGNRGELSRGAGTYGDYKKKINSDEAINLQRNGNFNSPVELEPPEAREYFTAMSGQFTSEESKWNVGPGLYAAVDPVQSESYAGNPWFLLEITVPAGSRYLDLRPNDGLVLSEKFARKWILENMDDDSLRGNISRYGKDRFVIRFKDLLRNRSLKKALLSAVNEFEVHFLLYAWNEHSVRLCRERTLADKQAFSFINPGFLRRRPRLRVFTQDMGRPDAEKIHAYGELLDKLEMSDLKLTQDGSFENQQVVYKALSAEKLYSAAKIRWLTTAWTTVLERRAFFASLVLNELSAFSQIFKTYEMGSCSTPNCPGLQPIAINPSTFQLQAKPELQYIHRDFYLDPPRLLSPAERERRMKLIERDTFGCSPDPRFAVENDSPIGR